MISVRQKFELYLTVALPAHRVPGYKREGTEEIYFSAHDKRGSERARRLQEGGCGARHSCVARRSAYNLGTVAFEGRKREWILVEHLRLPPRTKSGR